MSPAWRAGFGPAGTSLHCGDGQHRLRWADGTLQAVDHPDAEGELVLGALGGGTSPCLDLVMAWGRHSDDLSVLMLGPRSASDTLTFPAAILDEIATVSNAAGQARRALGMPVAQPGRSGHATFGPGASSSVTIYSSRSGRPAGLGRFVRSLRGGPFASRRGPQPPARPAAFAGRSGWIGYAPVGWYGRPGGWLGMEVDEGRAELIRLLALGPAFQFRLSAAVAHAWSADGELASRAERARPALTAALTGRLAPAAAHWLGIDPDEVEVNVHDGAGWGELALTGTGGPGRLQARLPVGWLARVWAPGFAVVDGHLVVSVLDAAWPAARVLAVRSPGREPADLTIRNDKGHWSVTSR